MYHVWSKSIWILTKLGTYIVLRRVWNPIDFQGQGVKFLPHNILVNTLEYIALDGYVFEFNHPNRDGSMVEFSCVFWFKKNNVNVSKTKLGTYLDLKRIWNRIDFQGQRSRSHGLIFRRVDTPRFALPLYMFISPLKEVFFVVKLYTKDYVCTKFGQNPLKDLDSRVFTRMLCSKNLTRWPWPLNYDLENQ
jgi:hypothetical protein